MYSSPLLPWIFDVVRLLYVCLRIDIKVHDVQEWFTQLVSHRLTLRTYNKAEGGQVEHMETSVLLAGKSQTLPATCVLTANTLLASISCIVGCVRSCTEGKH